MLGFRAADPGLRFAIKTLDDDDKLERSPLPPPA
jgi:hypothetical protein